MDHQAAVEPEVSGEELRERMIRKRKGCGSIRRHGRI